MEATDVTQLADDVLLISRFFHHLTPPTTELGSLTLRQIEAVDEVSQSPGSTLHELAEKLQLAKSTTSQLVDRLVRDNYLTRTINPENRREVSIHLGDRGKRYLVMRHEVIRDNLAGMLANLSDANRTRILEALRLIGVVIQEHGERGTHEA